MSDLKAIIPKRFYNRKTGPRPVARTVGELRELLAELPADLPIGGGEEDVADLIVYNITGTIGRPHLGIDIEDIEDLEAW